MNSFFKTLLFIMVILYGLALGNAAKDPVLTDAIENLLSENFSHSHVLMDSLISKYPDDPAPLFFKGMIFWRKSYNMNEYEDFDDSAMKYFKKAEKVSDQLLEKNDKDPYAYFFKGGTLGYMGTLKVREESYFSAGKYAFSGIRNLQKAYELDSSFWDMYYGTGLYHVTAANSSSIIKFLQKLLPIPEGDEELGMNHLKKSIERGVFSPVLAKSMLSFTYLYYKKIPDSAFYYIRPLVEKYPESTDFLSLLMNIYGYEALEYGKTDWAEFLECIRKLEKRMEKREEVLNDWYLQKILFYRIIIYFAQKEYELSEKLAVDYIEKYDNDEKFSGVVYWLLGSFCDSRGNRKKAIEYYEEAESCDEIGNLNEIIENSLKEPIKKIEFLYRGYYFSLPSEP